MDDGMTLMSFRLPKDLRRRFQSACKLRDVPASYLIRDYMEKQISYWEKQDVTAPRTRQR